MMQINEGWKIKIGCYEKQQCRSHLKFEIKEEEHEK